MFLRIHTFLRICTCACVLVACGRLSANYAHAFYQSQSLAGAWEMAYRPYEHNRVDYPAFTGKIIPHAVPGFWEDLVPQFRAAGLTDTFRVNPWYDQQTFPICGWAYDTTFPDIYGCFYYRRTFEASETGPAVLAFTCVRNHVHVWVNGRFVGFHAGFSTPFEMPLPEGVLKKGRNEIVLAISNNPNLGYCDYVCGLTTRATFRSTGGIDGAFELRFLKADLGDVYVTTAADLQNFTVHVSGKTAFNWTIAEGTRTLRKGSATGSFTLPTAGFTFWSSTQPQLYTLTLTTAAGSYQQKFGLRRLVARGEKLFLNNRPVYLRGVTEHCYFPPSTHLPRDLAYYRKINAIRKDLGFNFVRFHTFVPPEEYLTATDELGLLVHMESPNFVPEPEYAAIVAFARRHPSVVIYCTGNETRIDRLAEAYLSDVAAIVHRETDALFSPMSALRGVEYALMPGKDPVVKTPFKHNAERLARLLPFCDLFTSYQLGATSYNSLNGESAATLDKWGDAYGGKPRLSHEICIDGSYVDLSLEEMYPADSPIRKVGIFSGLRAQLAKRGLLDRAPAYFRNSCEWMRRIRKHAFEKVRAADRTAGYDFLGDINTHWHTFGYSVGLMDEFYRLKPGESVRNVRRYNSAAVILCDLGSDFNFTAGTTKDISFQLSNYADEAPNATFALALTDAGGRTVWSTTRTTGTGHNGQLNALGTYTLSFPAASAPQKYMLTATYAGGPVHAENEWELYAFPPATPQPPPAHVTVLTTCSEETLQKELSRGKRVLLLGSGPFKALPTTYRIGMAGRCSGNFATVIPKDHPALAGLPHEGFCGWQFRRLMEGGRAVQLETDVPFDPIIDVASAVKNPIRQAALFEYKVDAGILVVCSFKFAPTDPAAVWLKQRLIDYVASPHCAPAHTLTAQALHDLIAAPLKTAEANRNLARNPSDPSSDVRAGAAAQP